MPSPRQLALWIRQKMLEYSAEVHVEWWMCGCYTDQRGRVLSDIYNKDGNDQYKFYYHDPQHSGFLWLYSVAVLQLLCKKVLNHVIDCASWCKLMMYVIIWLTYLVSKNCLCCSKNNLLRLKVSFRKNLAQSPYSFCDWVFLLLSCIMLLLVKY